MPFRERAKRFFKPRSRTDSLSKTSTTESDYSNWPSNVYKPGEPMPRPKYRAPPKKEHKEKLEAFSFADAWRRKSFQSTYSPMGTRLPSRRNSFMSMGRKSVGNKSMSGKSGGKSRRNSVASTESANNYSHPPSSGLRPREGGHGAARKTPLTTEPEAEGDDDVTNVGLSRVQSRDKENVPLSRQRTAEDENKMNGIHTVAHDHQPFSQQDLELAMRKTHLAPPTQA
ncbi:hypothetical protein MBLNU230_g1940t1 [Neophaeotheca triangularis]